MKIDPACYCYWLKDRTFLNCFFHSEHNTFISLKRIVHDFALPSNFTRTTENFTLLLQMSPLKEIKTQSVYIYIYISTRVYVLI
jgi:hypothetical protein